MKRIFDDLKGIKKPEEKSNIEFSTNPINELKASFAQWESIVKENMIPGIFQHIKYKPLKQIINWADQLYNEALLLANKRINGIKSEDIDRILVENNSINADCRQFLGLYLTALVNNSCIDELAFNLYIQVSFLGYRLNRGKITNKTEIMGFFNGAYATGGILENYSKII